MPTRLPTRRPISAQDKKSIASIVWNVFLLVSALILAALVLARAEPYAFPPAQVVSQADVTQQPPAN